MTRAESTWQRLAEAGIVNGDQPSFPPLSPWYVRALLGIGGWLAAMFLLAFMGITVFSFNQPGMMTVTGLLMIAGAFVVFHAREVNTFATQAALAVSFAGQGLVISGIAQLVDDEAAALYSITVLEAVLAVFIPYAVHRLCCAAAAGIALATALTLSGAHYLSAGLLTAIIGTLWLNEFAWASRGSTVRPVAYGLTLALLAVQATWFARVHEFVFAETPQWVSPQIGAAVPGIVFMIVAAQLLVRWHRPLSGHGGMAALASAAAVAITSFEAPGISIALMIVLLGFAHGNRVLAGLGVTALLGYVSAYYYLLETTLLVKSMTLGATGAVLLFAREALARWFLTEAEVETGGA